MTVALALAANTARLVALRDFMDTGPGVARLRIYGNTRPASTSTALGVAPLVELPLLKPCGTIDAGALTLAPGAAALNAGSGAAVWARLINGAGDAVLDCDAGAVGNAAVEVWITGGGAAGAMLFEGGETTLVSAVFG